MRKEKKIVRVYHLELWHMFCTSCSTLKLHILSMSSLYSNHKADIL